MGWSSGSEIMEGVIKSIKQRTEYVQGSCGDPQPMIYVTDVYEILIHEFETIGDCDTLYECMDLDPLFEQAYKNVNPDNE